MVIRLLQCWGKRVSQERTVAALYVHEQTFPAAKFHNNDEHDSEQVNEGQSKRISKTHHWLTIPRAHKRLRSNNTSYSPPLLIPLPLTAPHRYWSKRWLSWGTTNHIKIKLSRSNKNSNLNIHNNKSYTWFTHTPPLMFPLPPPLLLSGEDA